MYVINLATFLFFERISDFSQKEICSEEIKSTKSFPWPYRIELAPQALSTLLEGGMAINDGHPKIPGSQGFKCNGGSRLPHLPDGDRAAISSSPTLPSSLSTILPSLALYLTNPYLQGRIPRRTQEQGSVAIGNCLMR